MARVVTVRDLVSRLLKLDQDSPISAQYREGKEMRDGDLIQVDVSSETRTRNSYVVVCVEGR